jgi:hypothetical protein
MKKILMFCLLLFSLVVLCETNSDSCKLVFDGFVKDLINSGVEVKYSIIEKGVITENGVLSKNGLQLKADGTKRKIFISTSAIPPFLVIINGSERVIRLEKPLIREVKVDLSKFPEGSKINWFLKEWEDLPFELYPVTTKGKDFEITLQLPLNEDAFIEIRAKGVIPYYLSSKAGEKVVKTLPPQSGWCREVIVKDGEGVRKKGCFVSFLNYQTWGTKIAEGKAVNTDEFGRAILKSEEVADEGIVVAFGNSLKPKVIESKFPTEEPLILTLERGEKLSGKVLNENSSPLKAKIVFSISIENPLIQIGNVELSTKDDGSYEIVFPDKREESSLFFKAEGYETQKFKISEVKSPLIVKMKKEKEISGRVEDKNGNPIEEAIIHLGDKEFLSDYQGNFLLKNIGENRTGWVEALGFFSKMFSLEEGQTFLKITLEMGNGGLKAKLVDSEGKPVEIVKATASFKAENGSLAQTGMPERRYKNGNFIFPSNVSFGKKAEKLKAEITLFSKGYLPVLIKDVNLEEGQIVDLGILVFERGFSIRGKVKLEDGSFASGAKVTLVAVKEGEEGKKGMEKFEKEQSGWFSSSDSYGDFTIDGLSSGKYKVFIDYPKYPEYEEIVEISSSGSIGEFLLKKGIDLTIKVLSKNGEARENYPVKLYSENDPFGTDSKPALTSKDGVVTFVGQKEGSYKIEVMNPKNELITKETYQFDEEDTYKEITLPSEKLEIYVNLNNSPLSNQNFYIAKKPENRGYGYYIPAENETTVRSSGNKIYQLSTDNKGLCTLEEVEKGEYILFSGNSPFQGIKSFTYDKENKIVVEIKGFSVYGKIVDKNSEKRGSYIVPLFVNPSIGPPAICSRTDSDGNFKFENIEPGRYVIFLLNAIDKENQEIAFEVSNSDVTLKPVEVEQ